MKKGQVVTLDDNEKYLLLLDTTQEGHKFFYANKLDDKENTTSEYEVFEETVEGDDTYLETVEDEEIKKFLVSVFTVDLLEQANELNKQN